MFEPTHKFYASYNEVKEHTEAVLCEMISFIDRFPCEYSWLPRVRQVLQDKGLVSSYSTSRPNDNTTHEKTKKLYKEYGQELVDMIYASSFGYIAHVFGFNQTYLEVFEEGYKRPENYKAPYKINNERVLNNSLHYRDLFVDPVIDEDFRRTFEALDTVEVNKKKIGKIAKAEDFDKYRIYGSDEKSKSKKVKDPM
jgi:hypothetical protein